MKKLLNDNDLGLPQDTRAGKFVIRTVKSFLSINQINALYDSVDGRGSDFARHCLDKLNISRQWSSQSLKNIPEKGAFITVANLPHGILDGLLLLDEIARKRPDAKIVTGFAPSQIDEIADNVISVDNFEYSNHTSFIGVRRAMEHLKLGHPLIVFPAQKIATFKSTDKNSIDSQWNAATVKFLMRSGVPLIPIHISGHNSLMFRLIGHINPKLQLVRMGHELLKKQGRDFDIEVGSAVNRTQIEKLSSLAQFEAYMRTNITLLGNRTRINSRAVAFSPSSPKGSENLLIDRLTVKSLDEHLTPQNYLLTVSGISFYVVNSSVVDDFDPTYSADKPSPAQRYIIGFNQVDGTGVCMSAVRFGDQVMLERSIEGLYTNTYFEYSHKYFDIIRQSIELGERQVVSTCAGDKNISSYIWRSALILLSREAQYRYLIGTSGIASDYSNLAKLMISTYIHTHAESKTFVKMALARHSAKRFHRPLFEGGLIEQLKDLTLANKLIADADPNYNEMPRTLETLLRQGAHLLDLSTNHLDKSKLNALMIVDIEELRKIVPRGTIDTNNWI
ncbi:MAG: hypothetical protein RR278_01970 [Mucinivorans sp.]